MAGERKGQARRTEVKQRGEMREETRGELLREQRGMERKGENKEGRSADKNLKGDDNTKR